MADFDRCPLSLLNCTCFGFPMIYVDVTQSSLTLLSIMRFSRWCREDHASMDAQAALESFIGKNLLEA